ncbi:MAG TPA: lanthionine synthetase LanC family protein, partial [Longimicrobium sp.]|nr:lanthionine synthetase LanC family protein [Longimicrobium sp.]
LCHGVLGNAELLAAAGAHLGNAAWERTARQWAAAGVPRAGDADPYLLLSERFAGLMCGLAGTGWGLLRFARPHAVPSVLALEAPRPRG